VELQFNQIKKKSEERFKKYGANINPYLPILGYRGVRSNDEIIKRVSIMAGMVYIAHQAPTSIIKEWIEEQGLYSHVTEFEKDILEKNEEEVTPEEILKIKWYVESLWALVWVLGINKNFQVDKPVGDDLIQMVPDVRKKQNSSILKAKTLMLSEKEIYEQADFYYRVHWHCVDTRLKGLNSSQFDEGTIMGRRKALDWVITPEEEWDEIDLST
jgi:hypothetical protein